MGDPEFNKGSDAMEKLSNKGTQYIKNIPEDLPPQEILRINMSNFYKSPKRTRKKLLVKEQTEPVEINEFKCKICKKVFKDKSYLKVHCKTHVNVCNFGCDLCEYKGKTKKYLSRHKKRCHSEPTANECGVCGKKFHFKSHLVQHTLVHTGEKPYKCEICGKAFNTSYSLNTHILIHTDKKPFQCAYCEYACRDSSTLRKHQARHLGNEKVYKCKMCDKSYKVKYKLKQHVAMEHLELEVRKYTCDQCGKVFQWKTNLTTHIQVVHQRSRTCRCRICGARLTNRGNLVSHMRRHVDVRPYRCTQQGCRKTFKTNSELRKHAVIHRPEEQFPCRSCGGMFARRHRRDRHVALGCRGLSRTVYECDHCGHVFRSKRLLSTHMSSQHGLMKKYQCDLCGVSSYRKRNILKHLRYGHGDDDERCCQLCKAYFQTNAGLKRHYVKRHNIMINLESASNNGTEDNVKIKEEPVEYDEIMDLLEIEKHEIIDDGAILEDILSGYENVVNNEEINERIDANNKDIDGLEANIYENENNNIESDVEPKRDIRVDVILPNTDKNTANINETIGSLETNMHEDTVRNLETDIDPRECISVQEILHNTDKNRSSTNENSNTNDARNKILNENMDVVEDTVKDANIKRSEIPNIDDTSVTLRNISIDTNVDKYIDKNNENANVVSIADKNLSNETDESMDKHENQDGNINDDSFDSKFTNLDVNTERAIKDDTKIAENLGSVKNVATNEGDTNEDLDELFFKDLAKSTIEQNKTNLKKVPERMFDEFFIQHTVKEQAVKKIKKSKRKSFNVKADKYVKEYLNNFLQSGEGGGCSAKNKPRFLERVKNDKTVIEKKNGTVNVEKSSGNQKVGIKKYNLKLKVNSHQCYVCFKLYPTKDDLMKHCQEHFDICTESMLTKCPLCQYVTKKDMKRHLRVKHDVEIDIPYSRIKENKDANGTTKYCFEVDGKVLEVIPSVKNLNKIESKKLDEKRRKRMENFVGKTKLVKKGDEWIVEKVKVDRGQYVLPSHIVSENNAEYLEKVREFSKKVKEEGKKMLFPCNTCEKKCQTLSALKLHFRKHEENPKPFKKKRWKHKEGEESVRDENIVTPSKNRLQAPKPIVNRHKCDKELMDFYRKNIKGGDIEFWQFLKIYNKMSRENVKDFEDLEGRTDFGIHVQPPSTKGVVEKGKIIKNNVGRKVMVSNRKEHLRRENKRIELRKKITGES